jgi:hypothetical protein
LRITGSCTFLGRGQQALFVFEHVLRVEHVLRGIADGGERGGQGRNARRRPTDAGGDGRKFGEVIVGPIANILGAIGNVIVSSHDERVSSFWVACLSGKSFGLQLEEREFHRLPSDFRLWKWDFRGLKWRWQRLK